MKFKTILLGLLGIITLSSCTTNTPPLDNQDNNIVDNNENNTSGTNPETNNGSSNTNPDINDDLEDNEISVNNTSFNGYTFNQITSSNTNVDYTLFQMQNEYMKEQGIYGDGCQWGVSLESSTSGDLMLYGTDVAGMFRSLDHGKTWEMCNKGFINRGAGMFAIDPFNSSHVLALGIGNVYGMHISLDMGQTFEYTASFKIDGGRYYWDGLEFDPTSYDEVSKETKDVYFSLPYQRDRANRANIYSLPQLLSKVTEEQSGLYKSSDGGRSFTQISNNSKLSDGILKFTSDGKMFIGNQYGLFYIGKNGEILETWLENDFESYTETTTLDGNSWLKCNLGITGLDIVNDVIYAQTQDGIYTLTTDTFTLSKINSTNYPTNRWGQFLEVSKTNPLHMIMQARGYINTASSVYSSYVYITLDGGITWVRSEVDNNSFFTYGSFYGREKLFIIDNSNDNNVISFGSDTLAYSTDKGLNFKQANGISNMMVGGKIHMNYYNPNLYFFTSQDYTSVISLDAGKTFKRITAIINGINHWSMYGGFAADELTYYGFADDDWYGAHKLIVTHDGGKTWTDTGLVSNTKFPNYALSSMQSYKNPNVLFAGEYYSKDKGYTWSKMNGCSMVYEINYTGNHEIYGVNSDGDIVVSYDDGDTFNIIFDKQLYTLNNRVSESIVDIAYDHVNNYIYVVDLITFSNTNGTTGSTNRLYKINLEDKSFTRLNILDDPNGYETLRDVEIDPNSVNTIYICSPGSSFNCSTSLQRSIDGGNTFYNLTASKNTNLANNIGGYEVSCLAVNYLTGELIYGSGCYGFGKINAPYTSDSLNHNEVKHTIKYVNNNTLVEEVEIENLRHLDLISLDIDGYIFEGWYFDKEFTEEVTDLFVDNSYILYAKFSESEKIHFYVGEENILSLDIKDNLDISKFPIPEKEGYTFAGWYTSISDKVLFDYKEYNTSVNVYAGFYKTSENLYSVTSNDMETYIKYSDHKINTNDMVDNEKDVSNRCAYIELDKNKTYLISMTMANRFRLGTTDTSFWKYNEPKFTYIDSDDTNSSEIINKDIRYVLNTGEYNKLIIYYYTENNSVDFMDIKESIGIYEILEDTLYS